MFDVHIIYGIAITSFRKRELVALLSLVCKVCAVSFSLFTHSFSVIARLCSIIEICIWAAFNKANYTREFFKNYSERLT